MFFVFPCVHVSAQEGKTALMWAAEKGHSDCVQLLLDAGADKKAKCNAWVRFGRRLMWLIVFVLTIITSKMHFFLCYATYRSFSQFINTALDFAKNNNRHDVARLIEVCLQIWRVFYIDNNH
jgi:ankyrin repeat protein